MGADLRQFPDAAMGATHWPRYVEGCERAGRPAEPANWRVAKSIFVADDAATARRYATDPDSPYRSLLQLDAHQDEAGRPGRAVQEDPGRRTRR